MSATVGASTDYRVAGWFWLVVAVFLSPHSWAMHLGLTYLVVPEVCAADATWVLHTITVGTAAGCALGSYVAWRLLRHAEPFRRADLKARRDHYVGWLGFSMGLFFLAVTLAEGVPALFISPCM
jgi:hypothetical protein